MRTTLRGVEDVAPYRVYGRPFVCAKPKDGANNVAGENKQNGGDLFKGSLREGAPDEIGWGRVRKGEDNTIFMVTQAPSTTSWSPFLSEEGFW